MSGRGPKRRRPPAALIAGAAGAAIALTGCGGGTVIDDRAAEIDVREGFEELGVKTREIDCPAEVEVERGAHYACRAETPKGAFRVVYRQLDEEGTVGRPSLEKLPAGP